jgi:hypothetical protein
MHQERNGRTAFACRHFMHRSFLVNEQFHTETHIRIISALGLMSYYDEMVKYIDQLTVLLKQCNIEEWFYQLLSFAAFQLKMHVTDSKVSG